MSFPAPEVDKTEDLSTGLTQSSKIINLFPPKEWLYIFFSLLLLIFSFLPAYSRQIAFGARLNAFEPSYNMWGILNRNGAPLSIESFFLLWNMPFFSILLPIFAATMFVVRRTTQKPNLTIGSLSIDQFASVAAGISFFAIFIELIKIINSPPSNATLLAYTDSLQIGLVLVFFTSIMLCIVSIFALYLKPLSTEILNRKQTTFAHPLASPPQFVTKNPPHIIVEKKQIEQTPQIEQKIYQDEQQETTQTSTKQTTAFWFAVPQTKTVLNPESNEEIFSIQPGIWNLALEEHENYFLVQHPNGTIGKLIDLRDIERA